MDASILRDLIPQGFEKCSLPLPGGRSGKVRDCYDLPDQRLLMVTSDRLSAFDRNLAVVLFKGQVLNQLSTWWFEQTKTVIANHLISTPDPNASVVIQTEPFLLEVVVRGYLTGVTTTALWYRYQTGERKIYGYKFPDGLLKNQSLAVPIITPTTKGGPGGHDQRLTCSEVVTTGLLDAGTWEQVQAAALELFHQGQATAAKAGIILVDTKYEFGRAPDGTILLIDEVHTPDSSRFWKADSYPELFKQGEEPENFDKEFVRLAFADLGYRGDGEPPAVPSDLWIAASQRYISIFERLTGTPFLPGEYPVEPRLRSNLRKAGVL